MQIKALKIIVYAPKGLKMYIYQIEVSNVCSLKCDYCPHPTQLRHKGLMSQETFTKCLQLFKQCKNTGPLFLHNFGEPLLHPKLPEMIAIAKQQGIECSFFTNGVRRPGQPFSDGTWRKLAQAGLRRVDFSAHHYSETEFRAITQGIIEVHTVFDPQENKLGTWAGQVGQPEQPDDRACLFEREQAFVILWDGRISTCCLDVEGQDQGQTLWVDDLLTQKHYDFAPITLCSNCNSMREHEDM